MRPLPLPPPLSWLPVAASLLPALRGPLGIESSVSAGVALTFDDGPHPEGTPAVLETLAGAGARATFFLVGEQVERRPALAAEIAARGHSVGVHCHRHTSLLRLSARELRADLDRAGAAIGEATGEAPFLYRPPFGFFTVHGLREARRRRWRPLLWTRDAKDWRKNATAGSISSRVTPLKAGDVVLLHDADFYGTAGSWRATVEALPRLVEDARRRGLALVAVSAGSLRGSRDRRG